MCNELHSGHWTFTRDYQQRLCVLPGQNIMDSLAKWWQLSEVRYVLEITKPNQQNVSYG